MLRSCAFFLISFLLCGILSAQHSPESASFRIWAGNSGGSGTAIGEHVVVTNAHVVGQRQRDIRVIQPLTGRQHTGTLLVANRSADIALVYVRDVLPYVRISRTGPAVGMQCSLVGYGSDNVMKLGNGRFLGANSRQESGVPIWDCTAESVSGDSGGGIFDSAGQLVAINWGADPRNNYSASTSSACIIEIAEQYAAHWKIQPTQCFGRWGGGQPSWGGQGGGAIAAPKQPVRPFAQPPAQADPGCDRQCVDAIADSFAALTEKLNAIQSQQLTREQVLEIIAQAQPQTIQRIADELKASQSSILEAIDNSQTKPQSQPQPAYFEIRKRAG